MKDSNLSSKDTQIKFGLIFLSLFIACIPAEIIIVIILFMTQTPFISSSPVIAALIFAAGAIVALFLGIVTFKKTKHYLLQYML